MTAFLAEISAFLMDNPGVLVALILGSVVGVAVGWGVFLGTFRESLPPKSRGWGTAMGALALGGSTAFAGAFVLGSVYFLGRLTG